jgi:hypothetical protein
MVSLPARGTSLRLTASSATSRTVHRAQPSGGSLQTMAMDALLLAVLQQSDGSRQLFLIERPFESGLLVAMSDFCELPEPSMAQSRRSVVR